MTRREFLGTTAAAAAFTIVPRHVLGGPGYVAPNDKINLAMIGVGGQGTYDMTQFMALPEVQVVAVCDVVKEWDYSKFYFGGVKGREPARELVDKTYAEKTGNGSYKACVAYVDFYDMLEKESGIDAISVATTDSLHAFAAMAGLKKRKHVYCQKPLTHDVWEARQLRLEAKKQGVMTQMGNQGRAGDGNRQVVEWIAAGAIGNVHEVHCWTNRPANYWPQGIKRPDETPSVPPTIDWDRWLGPAQWRYFHPLYTPFNWRGWWDFGTGALGDMGCHIMDTPVWALNLAHPSAVQASATPFTEDSGPIASIVTFEFPARGKMPEVKLIWYEGGLTPPRPSELEDGYPMGDGSGVLFIGDKGKLMCNTYGAEPRLIPIAAHKKYKQPAPTIERVPDGPQGIYADFIKSIKTGKPACSNFEVSGPLTEIVVMGNLAVHMKGQRLLWDGEKMECTNVPEANKYVKREYREGWSL
ncbi:Gfo/Idh/MocA family oxidoreductase [candidate division KSB1 bacterium]|nr:Gfo/Idh/MocA family oxidoreductase [candidate division KSB1 bacterium]